MRKIVFVTPSLRGGGAERVVVHLLRHMNRTGLTVSLIALKLEGPYVGELPADTDIVDLNTERVRHSLPKLVRELNRLRPDVVVSTLDHLNVALLAVRPFLLSRPKIVIREANAPSLAMRNRSKLYLRLYRRLYPRADRVIALSRGMADDLIRFAGMPKQKISVINNPVPMDEVRRRSEETVDHPWLTNKSLPVCISVGRLVEQKNYEMQLYALANALQSKPCRLLVLGEGPDRAKLQQLAKELHIERYVDFAGFAPNPYAYMAKADLFILSSSWEGMPNVLLEALALGLPVVATDCIGVPDVLDDGRFGTMIRVGAVDELADAIVRTAVIRDEQDKALLDRAKYFSIEKIAGEYRSLLINL